MLNHRKIIALAAIALTIQGCYSAHYYKNGYLGTQSELNRDGQECSNRAASYYPSAPRQVVLENAKIKGGGTNCMRMGDIVQCSQGDSEIIPAKTTTVDDNAAARNANYTNCMVDMGWRDIWIKNSLPVPPDLDGVKLDGKYIRDSQSLGPHGSRTEAPVQNEIASVNMKRAWCPEIDNFCDTISGPHAAKDKVERKNMKRDWCPDIDNFCDTK